MLPVTDSDAVAGHIADWVRRIRQSAGSTGENDAAA
jgi:hypothetical protein